MRGSIKFCHVAHSMKIIEILLNHINQYIYIYISRDLVQESIKFSHVAHSMKRIKILLSHIRDKNKFKNKDSLFLLV